jgi:hypothetical protein
MYTFVRVRLEGRQCFGWSGHIYDVSASGMRFELDKALTPGVSIEVRASLPGAQRTRIHVKGHVVRLHEDAPEPGPVRMSMAFDQFCRSHDRRQLSSYLAEAGLKAA